MSGEISEVFETIGLDAAGIGVETVSSKRSGM